MLLGALNGGGLGGGLGLTNGSGRNGFRFSFSRSGVTMRTRFLRIKAGRGGLKVRRNRKALGSRIPVVGVVMNAVHFGPSIRIPTTGMRIRLAPGIGSMRHRVAKKLKATHPKPPRRVRVRPAKRVRKAVVRGSKTLTPAQIMQRKKWAAAGRRARALKRKKRNLRTARRSLIRRIFGI